MLSDPLEAFNDKYIEKSWLSSAYMHLVTYRKFCIHVLERKGEGANLAFGPKLQGKKSWSYITFTKPSFNSRLHACPVHEMANLGNPIRATRPCPNLVTSKPSPPPLEPCFIFQTNNKNHTRTHQQAYTHG